MEPTALTLARDLLPPIDPEARGAPTGHLPGERRLSAATSAALLRGLGGLAFTWAGLVAGISFLEAPVKFTAPSLTLAVGLDVGRHVFGALNRAELVLALASVALVWASQARRGMWVALGAAWAVLLAQTVWLLPALDARAVVLIAGGTLPPEPSLHWLYGLAEVAKVGALVTVGWLASFAAAPRAGEPDRHGLRLHSPPRTPRADQGKCCRLPAAAGEIGRRT